VPTLRPHARARLELWAVRVGICCVLAGCSGSTPRATPTAPTKASVAVRDLLPPDVASDRFCSAVAAVARLVESDGTPSLPESTLAAAWTLVAAEAPAAIRTDAELIAAYPADTPADIQATVEARRRLGRFHAQHCRGALPSDPASTSVSSSPSRSPSRSPSGPSPAR
jgi:hypothetical protein